MPRICPSRSTTAITCVGSACDAAAARMLVTSVAVSAWVSGKFGIGALRSWRGSSGSKSNARSIGFRFARIYNLPEKRWPGRGYNAELFMTQLHFIAVTMNDEESLRREILCALRAVKTLAKRVAWLFRLRAFTSWQIKISGMG